MGNGRARAQLWHACAIAVVCSAVAAPQRPPADSSQKRIVFVGDSLVHRSVKDHGMLDTISAELTRRYPAFDFSLIDAGENGDRIADIQGRLDHDVLNLRPQAVILYWDSDVSDVDESRMSPSELQRVRNAYERTLRDVVSRMTATVPFVVVSGPTLLGERPRGRNERDGQLDAYRQINRRVVSALGVRYVDTREAFLAGRPAGAPVDVSDGLLTEDGEHLNDRGAILVANLFVEALEGWLQTQSLQEVGRKP